MGEECAGLSGLPRAQEHAHDTHLTRLSASRTSMRSSLTTCSCSNVYGCSGSVTSRRCCTADADYYGVHASRISQ